jgi:protein O-mannosyl-transferase
MSDTTLPRGPLLWSIAAAFFLVTFTVYYPSLWNPFVRWDDGLLIYENPAIRAITPATLKVIFTSFDPELYIPLTFFSYQVDYMLAGTNPIMYHLTNLILHTLNALLVCWLFLLLGISRSVALLIALLFSVHPLHTEAIAWASARKDVLSAFFFLLSVNFFLSYKKYDRQRFYSSSIVAFLLALLAKVVAAVLPGILLLIFYRTESINGKKWAKELSPFVALSVIFIVIALIGKQSALSDSSLLQMILMATKSTVFYLQKLMIPTGLSVLYPYTGEFGIADFVVPIGVSLVLVTVMLFSLVRKKGLGLGLGFFFLTLLPTFTNFSKGGDFYFASDRYAYLPSIGILFILAHCMNTGIREYWNTRFFKLPNIPVLKYASALLVISTFGWMSHTQAAVWSSSEQLFQHAVDLYPNTHVAHNNLGNIYYRRDELEEALAEYNVALSIRDHHRTRSNYAAVLRKQGKIEEALREYDNVLSKNSNSKEAHFGLGLLAAQQGNTGQAVASYSRALELDPSFAEVHINFGALYMQMGDVASALEQYDQALRILPFSASAHYNRAIALRKLKRTKDAIAAYEQAVQLEPTFVAARINLGILYHERRKIDESIEQFDAVLRYDPNNARAKSALQQLRN